MKLTNISIGRVKESYLKMAIEEFTHRINGFKGAKVMLVDVDDELKLKEKLTEKSRKNTFVFSMCVEGRQMSSVGFAKKLEAIYMSEKKKVYFIIGGAYGLSEELKNESDMKFSLSNMTLPHRYAKIMLLEQIYRALTIQNQTNYHH
jgi:23S rRNA (pseudouridine1915-N3)-methyltransferase